jgi:CheY-like chemotaxis protein
MKKTTVLVAEDDSLAALDVVEGLRSLGYTVPDAITSGEALCAGLKGLSPDAIVMDVHLSGTLDGFSTAIEIRRSSDIQIIFLSGVFDEDCRRKSLSLGCELVQKPFDEITVDTAIQKAIQSKGSNARLSACSAGFPSAVTPPPVQGNSIALSEKH